MKEIGKYLSEIQIPIWIGIAGFIISVINLVRSIMEKRIRVNATIGTMGDEVTITIFNQSPRNIIITSLELFKKNGYFSKKENVRPLLDDPDGISFSMAPYSKHELVFDEEYPLPDSFFSQKRRYVTLAVSNKRKITLRL